MKDNTNTDELLLSYVQLKYLALIKKTANLAYENFKYNSHYLISAEDFEQDIIIMLPQIIKSFLENETDILSGKFTNYLKTALSRFKARPIELSKTSPKRTSKYSTGCYGETYITEEALALIPDPRSLERDEPDLSCLKVLNALETRAFALMSKSHDSLEYYTVCNGTKINVSRLSQGLGINRRTAQKLVDSMKVKLS